MRQIKYIFQMSLFLLFLLPTISNAEISDPRFVKCGLFPSALNSWSSIEHKNGNVVIDSSSIYADGTSGGSNIQCRVGGSSQDCTVTEMSEPIPTLPIFKLSPITTNHTASGTERDEQYGDVTIPSNSTVTFLPSGRYNTGNPVMEIRSLVIEDGATIIFNEGDYWIGDWVNYANINIRTTGKVRLFIQSNLTLTENNIDFNYSSGLVENLFIFVYGNVVYSGDNGNTDMTAYLYTQGSFVANHSGTTSRFKGAVTASGTITLNSNQEYQYNDSGLLDKEWGVCTDYNVYTNADDLCFTDITYSSSCIGDDEFKGGVGCTQTITLKNRSDSEVKNSYGNIFILDHTGATSSLESQCGIDGTVSDWSTTPWCYAWDESIDMGSAGLGTFDNYIAYGSIVYNPQEEHSIFAKSSISAPLFDGNNLYAIYQKDGSTYGGRVYSCDTTVEFELPGYEIAEDIDRLYLTETVNPIIKLNRAVDYDVTVSYSTSDGTAKSSLGDYIAKSGTVTIPAGELRATLEIFIYNDQPIEIQEEFFITLRNPSNGVKIGFNESTKIAILEQDDAPTCFEDNFDNGILHDEWRVLSATGGFTPQIVNVNGDGRLRVTDGRKNLSTVVTRDVEFESSQNLIIVEFEYYAYGGCGSAHDGLGTYGADGIVNILFDSTVGDSPTPGGGGGSMGYAQFVNNTPGFEGGWLGLGLDEYGNFGKEAEGRKKGSSGRIENNAVIRGSGSGMDGYEYLDSVKLTDDGVGELGRAEIAVKNSSDYYSGLYKMVVDARDPAHLYINLMRTTTHSENDYATIIEQFDAKDPQYGQGATPDKIRYAISGGTGEGCNNHELSWLKLRGNCSNYDPSGSYSTGPFASQDMWRRVSSSDFNISTKIANEPFDIRVLSLDETHRATELKDGIDARWTLKYMNASKRPFLYKSDGGVSYNNIVFDSSTYKERSSYDMLGNNSIEVDKAYKDMYIEITYCAEYNSTIKMKKLYPWSMCGEDTSGAISENQEAEGRRYYIHEGDHFAVRPSYFQFYPRDGKTLEDTKHIHAGKDYNLTLCAFDGVSDVGSCSLSLSNSVKEYNQNLLNLTLQKRMLFNDGTTYNSTATRDNKHKFSLDGTLTFNSDALTAMVNGQSRFINSSGNPTGSPRAMGVTFDNVGDVEIGVIDETWAIIDADDSPSNCMTKSEIRSIQSSVNSGTGAREPFSRVVCMGSGDDNLTLTFIPDHFEIKNARLSNHRGGEFTYMASKGSISDPEIDPLMSGGISMSIEAQNTKDEVVTNFTQESTGTYPNMDINTDGTGNDIPKPSDDAYYENPVTITFNIDEEQNPLAIAGDDDYKLHKVEINHKSIMGFKRGVLEIGVEDKLLVPYYLRTNNKPINPFDINSSEVTLNITSVYPSETLSTDANITVDSSIDFYYARVKPSQDFYEDVTEDSIQTPVMITIYCDPFTDPNNCSYSAIDPVSGATNESRWYKAKLHRANKNDGNVTIEKGDIIEGSGSPSLDIGDSLGSRVLNIRGTDGTYYFSNVSKGGNPTLPMTVAIELADVGTPAMSPWLIYGDTLNGISSDKPEPFYKVRFIDGSSWTGIGTDGSIVDRDTGISKNRRMDW